MNQQNCEHYLELLSLRALGLLEEADDLQLQQHLNSGCVTCAEEWGEVQEAAGLLAYGLPTLQPPSALKKRLFEKIRSVPVLPFSMSLNLVSWQESGMTGVSLHWLRQDSTTGTTAALVKIEEGCRFTDHRHVGAEDCLVLHGTLSDSRGIYKAGDYVHYEADSIQRDVTALSGDCIIFVVNHGGIEPIE